MSKTKSIAYPNGKQIVSIKDADGKVLWSAGGAVEVDDLWIGDGESVFFSKRTQPLAQAIVRGGCHISVDNPTPDNIGTIVCNNGEVTMSNEGVISVSGSPSYFDLNEERYNLPNLFGGLGVQDEYNMLTGVITRNAQVYALRGSMDWVEQSIEGQSYFALPTASYKVIISTHFHQVGTDTPANVGEFVERNGYYVFNYDGVNDNIADFEDYLDECYAAGEAVLVVGARFVSVTEQDDAFDLQQINGKNVVNLFVNDEYSTIALKYKALYPPNDEIWVESTDGTKIGVGALKDINNTSLTTIISDTPIYPNVYKTKASGEIDFISSWGFAAKTKRCWIPPCVRKYGDAVGAWGSCNSIQNVYFSPNHANITSIFGGALAVGYYKGDSLNIKTLIVFAGNSSMDVSRPINLNQNNTYLKNCRTIYYKGKGAMTSAFSGGSYVRNFVYNRGAYVNTTLPSGMKNKTAFYVESQYIDRYKAYSQLAEFKKNIFPIPDCWL